MSHNLLDEFFIPLQFLRLYLKRLLKYRCQIMSGTHTVITEMQPFSFSSEFNLSANVALKICSRVDSWSGGTIDLSFLTSG